MTFATTDAIAELLRKEMDAEEVCDLLRTLSRSGLTVCEMAGLLTILRGAMDRRVPG